MDYHYLTFLNQFLKDKEYIIILCLKELHESQIEIDKLYEVGLVSLYQIYRFYQQQYHKVDNFDYIAYHYVLNSLLNYIKEKDQAS